MNKVKQSGPCFIGTMRYPPRLDAMVWDITHTHTRKIRKTDSQTYYRELHKFHSTKPI